MDRGTWQALVHGVAESRTQLSNFHFHLEQAVLYFFSSLTSDGILICGSQLTMTFMLPTSWHPGSASRQHLDSPWVFSGSHSSNSPKHPPSPHLSAPSHSQMAGEGWKGQSPAREEEETQFRTPQWLLQR